MAAACHAKKTARVIPGISEYSDEVLVTFKDTFTDDDISSFSSKHITKAVDRKSVINEIESYYGLKKTRLYLPVRSFTCYRISDISRMGDVVAALRGESVVQGAFPNYKRHALYMGSYTPYTFPNDPYYKGQEQWGVWQVRADKAYNAGLINMFPPRQVIVAVVDTGLLLSPIIHEDMVGMTINGYNVITPTSQPNDDEVDGHGTHVAGVIAANTDNSKGIMGSAYCNVSWTAKVLIMPVKVLDSQGDGYDSDIYTGIQWAVDNGANVINLSLGGTDPDSVLQNAVNYAYTNGVVVVAAAGNNSTSVFYPAAYSTVISVSATDMDVDIHGNTIDTFASFSNFGKVECSAPGVDILSCDNNGPANYSYLDGTSFSSPHVAGLAALLKLQDGTMTPDDIRQKILNTCDDAGQAGFDRQFGWGRVNFYRALTGDYNVISSDVFKTYNWPNPFSPNKDVLTTIDYLPSVSSDITVSIYDGGGGLVWKTQVPAASVKANTYNTLKWDGYNSDGKRVSNGTYFYVVKSSGGAYGKNKICVVY
jgi:subtilisin family serine protease